MAKRKEPLTETLKFILRYVIALSPLILNFLLDGGYTEEAAALSAAIAIIDKYQFVNGSKIKLPI